VVGRIRLIKKSNGLIGIRTSDLLACNIMPQPNTLPRAPKSNLLWNPKFHYCLQNRQRSPRLVSCLWCEIVSPVKCPGGGVSLVGCLRLLPFKYGGGVLHHAVVTCDPHNEYGLSLSIKCSGENLRLFSLIYFHYYKDTSKKYVLIIT
jgi:hypothetical protein